MFEEQLSQVGRGCSPMTAIHQPGADVRLEGVQMMADRGLAEVKPAAGGSQRAGLRDGAQDNELAEFEHNREY